MKTKRMRASTVALLVIIFSLLGVRYAFTNQFEASVNTKELYVASNGNDTWPGTKDQPFLTVEKAKLAARSLTGNIDIILRSGVYDLSAGLYLSSADSGKSGTVTYRSYSGEAAILRGSKPLTGFSSIGGGIYQADLTANGMGGVTVKDLYANGTRQILARYPNYVAPNYSKSDPWEGNFTFAADTTPAVKNKVVYTDSFTRPNSWTNPTTGSVNIFSGPNYVNSIVPITSVDKTSKTINFGSDVGYDMQASNRFFVQNIREELDVPGEWFFDAANKKILFIPPAGFNINTDRVSVPTASYLVNDTGASNIKFSNLVFEETQKSDLYILNANDVSVEGSVFRNTGERGIHVQGSSQRTTINNNIVYDTGDEGVWIDQTDLSFRKTLTSSSQKVTNNRIYQVGRVIKGGSGIRLSTVVGATVSNNEIYNTPRIGIFYSGNDSVIESNHVHDVNQETQDTAGIYTIARSWLYRGNTIKNNYVHDTGGYGKVNGAWAFNYYSWGIYLDDFSSGTKAYYNLVVRAPKGGFQIHSGRDNTVTNNIVVEPSMSDAGMVLQGEKISNSYYPTMWTELSNMSANGFDKAKYFSRYPELSTITGTMDDSNSYAGNVVTKNIIYFPKHPTVRLYWVRNFIGAPGSISDSNIFWNGGTDLVVSHPESAGGKLSWAQWKAYGFDLHSIIADPLFKDPSHDNYEILPGSPVLQVGFEPFIATNSGPTTPPPDVLKKAAATSSAAQKKAATTTKTAPVAPAPTPAPTVTAPTEGEGFALKDKISDTVKVLGLALTPDQYRNALAVALSLALLTLVTLVVLFPRFVPGFSIFFRKLFRRPATSSNTKPTE